MSRSQSLTSTRLHRYGLDATELEVWPDVDAGALSKTALNEYLRRKRAIQDFLDGVADKDLREKHDISVRWAADILQNRCLQPHPDGRVYGWRGAVKYARIKTYRRSKPVKATVHGLGTAGALGLLLSLEPDLKDRFDKLILKTVPKDKLGEIRRPRHATWTWFLNELKKLGYETKNQWPFSVKTRGYSSIVRYIDALLKANPKVATVLIGGPDIAKKLLTGDGRQRPDMLDLQRVEMDAHKLDCRICIMVPQNDGDWSPKIVHRLWVIAMQHVATRAVLGYYLSLRREVSSDDVLSTVSADAFLTTSANRILTRG